MLVTQRGCLQTVLLTTYFVIGVTASGPALAEEETILDLTLGGGLGYEPDYEGSDDYEFGPFPYAELSLYDGLVSLSVGGLEAGLPIGDNAYVGVGLGYGDGRDEDENAALDGLGDVDDTYIGSVGGGLLLGPAELSVTYSQDLDSGHEGYTVDFDAETSVEMIEDRAEIGFGAGATWASQNYTEAFFGISADQAAASGLDQFDADAGFKSAGVEVSAGYALTEHAYLELEAGYLRLLGDAADSPIVDDLGSPNQFSVGLLLALQIGLL